MKDRKFFPLFIDMNGKRCLVVGGGNIALRKINTLLQYGAIIKVIAPEIKDEIVNLDIEIEKREFKNEDIEGSFLVIAGTDNEILNSEIVRICEEKGILVNNITSKIEMNTKFSAIVEDSEYKIAITTIDGNPKKSVLMKNRIKSLLKS